MVLKPSEVSSNSAAVIQEAMEASLDSSCYRCIQGAIPETQALLSQKWDKICYTGGERVAKIVAQAAVPNLTPLLLELGGKNPAFVTKNANVKIAARRLAWGKCTNAGQICVSQNYMLVDKEVVDSFVAALKANIQEFYPEGAENSPDYGRIVNINHFRRIKGMIDSSKGEIVFGGKTDEKTLFIEPTIIKTTHTDDPVLMEESFGPIFTVLPVNNLDEAIDIANSIDPTPLGCYPFGNSKETEKGKPETIPFLMYSFREAIAYQMTFSSSPVSLPLRWCLHQRFLHACLHCQYSLRWCWLQRYGSLPWQALVRCVCPSSHSHQHTNFVAYREGIVREICAV